MADLFNPTEEHKVLRDMIRSFAEREVAPQAEEYDRSEKFNLELFRKLGELGLLGITAPVEFGGSGMDAVAAVIAHEELSAQDPGFCLAYLAHSMLFVNNLAVNGNDEQRAKYLPGACSGELVGGMCMSEPGAGTDVLGMSTVATKDGDSYVLNGQKMWITNGAIAEGELGDVFLVYAKIDDRDSRDVSLFIVEKGMEGFELGQKIHDKLGMRASTTAELVFDDCRIPAENLVGKPGGAVKSMMRNLAIERVTLAAMSLGIARRSVEIMNSYARERKSFGKPINRFGQIQRHIAESYAEYMAGRSYVYNVASQLELDKFGHRIDSDGVKLYCSTMGKNVADRAIQVLGGYGYVGEYHVERLWRDAKLLEIGGGTNEAHQKNMTRDLSRLEKLV
ncbi:isovaleryl-CoA dehydrogenase [Persicimonas caeni]|uniref:Isovaleryl-CoA dehydrogenase n=1 Tax=Persicimonas caeni TaxID=2292766 RepID=A0A4Y6PRT6_PERCE|nr:acyl-CoA dehydrogenase family protein [Persicimonas caeni]QDG51038.1 isovaleryl-CoA dehydrogenase [Persicimonas caeni]QED32259.1 isovaleryl-CoA dehydrogenase [Persicimonas caeni]